MAIRSASFFYFKLIKKNVCVSPLSVCLSSITSTLFRDLSFYYPLYGPMLRPCALPFMLASCFLMSVLILRACGLALFTMFGIIGPVCLGVRHVEEDEDDE